MSAGLESVGVLIKGTSSLRLPGSSSLTRRLGHQRGSDGRRAQPRRGLGWGRWWGWNTVTDRRARGQARIGVHSADLCKRQRHELFPWQALPFARRRERRQRRQRNVILQDLLPAASDNTNSDSRSKDLSARETPKIRRPTGDLLNRKLSCYCCCFVVAGMSHTQCPWYRHCQMTHLYNVVKELNRAMFNTGRNNMMAFSSNKIL